MKKLPLLLLLLWRGVACAQVTYQNPVLPGSYPDPSVCRVGDDYYLVNSTFSYYPGVPIFHSKNLVNWEQLGYVLSRPEQLPLGQGEVSMGIFASTIRHHDGVFYMITTNTNKGNFYVTATNAGGPWSNPVYIETPGIDPSLFWDDDGRAYVTSTQNWGPVKNGIVLSEIDLKTGKLLTPPTSIWKGTGGRFPEGPHIYKKDGQYYLLIAEGGTEYAHSVTIARSAQLAGPYTANPANPILTHANHIGESNPVQGVGHADMVQAADGSWWLVALGFRPVDNHQVLGRETFLAPVSWPAGGWPVVNGNGTLDLNMSVAKLPGGPATKPDYGQQTDFAAPTLGMQWNYLNNPVAADYSLGERPGYLRLHGAAHSLGQLPGVTFVGRRQQQADFVATTTLDFKPAVAGDEAGLAMYRDQHHYYTLAVQPAGKGRELVLSYHLGHIDAVAKRVALAPGPVRLRVTGTQALYSFSFAQGSQAFAPLGEVDTRYVSTETAGGMTGVYVGLYATGNGRQATAPADFDEFSYVPAAVAAPTAPRP